MDLSRQEVNLRRLLAKCELMIKSNQKDDERFPKYINSLEQMLEEVKSLTSNNTKLPEYTKRIRHLKINLGMLSEQDLATGDGLNKLTAREELLEVRKRPVTKEGTGKDFDNLIDFHQNIQEKIANEMIELTNNLKEHSTLANKIIKKDTEVLGRSNQLTDANFSKLKVESEKLQQHSKKAWKCWMWILILIVLVVFVNMVLFMKVMKKK
nr:vesicle transport protein USE1 [Onthophagus taurus]